ncbi:MAG: ParB/RepB/Spo0J family partition protein [Alphaproteobacteria bacterium]|nr:ParB/RepB/Spo0J family partition protein [Alphaproteobacteria bacterium]
MLLKKVDPRALKDNPDRSRRTKSTPQADALLLATIKLVGILQPPVVVPESGGGNGYRIEFGHRRVKQAIAAGLDEIEVLEVEASDDHGAMRSMIENVAQEPLNPVDQWRGIERLVVLGWTEEAIAAALGLALRRVRQLRLLGSVLPAMLDHIAKGDMPNEQQLRTIAAAPVDDQKEVWKKYKPSKDDPKVTWWNVSNALTKTRMYAKHASFDDELTRAYGIEWVEDLFGPADEDGRYTTNVEAYLGAQQEWMTHHLPKRGVIAEVNSWGEPVLPPKAERVYGKAGKSDRVAMYLDRNGTVQSVGYRMPTSKKAQSGGASVADDAAETPRSRPDVTRRGIGMIGDFRTDALHEALSRAPIASDTLLALLVLALAGRNITIASGASDDVYGFARMDRHAVRLIGPDGKLGFDKETLQQAARGALIEVLSCRENRSDSGIVARIAGEAIGADAFLPNMGIEEFLSCLSRPALEGSCTDTSVLPRPRVKDTRAALVAHFAEGRFVHPSALFAPDAAALANWLAKHEAVPEDEQDEPATDPQDSDVGSEPQGDEGDDAEPLREAA